MTTSSSSISAASMPEHPIDPRQSVKEAAVPSGFATRAFPFPRTSSVSLPAVALKEIASTAFLNAARGAFCTDKAVMAELDRFARVSTGRPRKAQSEEAA